MPTPARLGIEKLQMFRAGSQMKETETDLGEDLDEWRDAVGVLVTEEVERLKRCVTSNIARQHLQ